MREDGRIDVEARKIEAVVKRREIWASGRPIQRHRKKYRSSSYPYGNTSFKYSLTVMAAGTWNVPGNS
ncbi:hypothetical protein C0J52_28263 [Blattella germanica]|nr:hypothetical protein C0J52_28263 [Blattella germanica]